MVITSDVAQPGLAHPRDAGTARWPGPTTGGPPRDRVLDLVRLTAMALVVVQHWLMPVLAVDGGAIDLARAQVLEHAWPLTWLTQVMPLVFFTAGAAAVLSLRGGRPADGAWVSRRLVRLVGGVVVLGAVWLPLPPVLLAAGLPDDVVSMGGRLVGALLWFLVVLVLLTALTPVLVRLADRFRGAEVAALAVGAVLVDVLRFGMGWELVGYLNAVLVWAAVYAIGVHHAHGRLRRLTGVRALLIGIAGLVALGLAVAAGPYPPAMIGLPGTTVSNMNPPSAALLALAVAQVGLLLAVRPALERLVARRPMAAIVDRCAPHTMTVYLWHTPAVVLVAAAVVALRLEAPEVGSPGWWLQLPVWFLAAGIVLVACVGLFGALGLRAAADGVGPVRGSLGFALVAAGLGALTVAGFDPARLPDVLGPVVGLWCLACGALLLGARPGRVRA